MERAVPLSGCGMPSSVEEDAEPLAVLGEVDGVRARPEDLHARAVEGQGQLQGRLAAELDHDALGLLHLENAHDVLEGEGLEVEAVRRVVVGRDRLGVAVDHDGLEPLLPEGEGGVAAAVVELDPLADAVGAAPEDHDLPAARRLRLAFPLVGRVEVRRVGLELGGAGVDPLVDRLDLLGRATLPHLGLGGAGELRQAHVGEARALGLPEALAGERRTSAGLGLDPLLEIHDLLELREKPGVDPGHAVDVFVAPTEVEGALHVEDPVGVRVEELLLDAGVVDVGAGEAGGADLQAPQPLLQRLLEGAADGHHLARRTSSGSRGAGSRPGTSRRPSVGSSRPRSRGRARRTPA